jgi:C-terminal peptidase prc
MKTLTSQNRLAFVLILFVLAALACQTLTQGLDQITVTSTSQPVQHTNTALPPQNKTPTAIPPTAIPPTTIPPTATPTLVPIDQDQQLEIFQSLWSVIDQNYLYPDFNGQDWNATYEQYRQQIETGLDTDTFYQAMDDMVYGLGDEHSIYLNPRQVEVEDAEYESGHDYVGIGVLVQYLAGKQRGVILLTFPGGPADQAGLKSRDSILAVEGVPLDDEEGAALDLLLGIEGTPVTLTVQTPGESPRKMTVHRARITGSLPVLYEPLQTPFGKRIGYMVIPNFSDSTIDTQVGEALSILSENQPLAGLILDNRINGGGWDNVMSSTLSYFTSGKVGYFINRFEQEVLEIPRRNIGGSADLPIVVLIGPNTVSFGEIFSGILKDQGRAILIGETTDGNVEVLWGYGFDDGSRAWIAHDTFEPINHSEWDWEYDGIIVDFEVPADWDEYTTQTDPAIQAALTHLDQ